MIIAALATIIVAIFIYRHFLSPANNPPDMGGAPVSVAIVTKQNIQLWSDFSGRLVAVDSAQIRPRVSGTIEKIYFKEGQWVEKGNPLFGIDQRVYAAALQSAEARAQLANSELARAKTLLPSKAIAQRDYDQYESNTKIATADLARAKLDYEFTTIRSPLAGYVSRAELTVGNLVDAGGNAPILTTVVSNRPIYADFDIDEQTYLHYLTSAGNQADKLKNIPAKLVLSGSEGQPVIGHVLSFDNQLNVSSGTLRVRAIFDNNDGLLIPGLFAKIQMGSPHNDALILINEKAINTDQSVKFVWVVGEDNKVIYRPVKLGPMAGGLRVITDGLQADEKIVINGTQRVMMPGQPVTPSIVPMDSRDDGKVPVEKSAGADEKTDLKNKEGQPEAKGNAK